MVVTHEKSVGKQDGDIAAHGNTMIRTPHLDRLAARSAVFPRGYVPTSLCRPSLVTMITGLYPHQHKVSGNDPPRGTDRREMLGVIANQVANLLVARRLPDLLRRPFTTGLLYGLILYGIMYWIVLPLRWPSAWLSATGGSSAT